MHTLDDLRMRFRQVGGGLTVVSALMTGVFGWSMGSNVLMAAVLAGGLMCATFASAYVWPFVAAAYRDRTWSTFAFLCAFGVLCTGTDLSTNFGSIAWQRTADVDTALKQDAIHDARADAVTEDKDALASAKETLRQLKLANPWAETVTAEALRAPLPPIEAALKREANNCGRRKCATPDEGKGPAWQILANQKAEIEGKIATAEERNSIAIRIADLEKRLGERREVAVTAKKGESATRDMNLNLASMFTLSLQPTEAAQHWTNKGVAWLVAGFFAFGAMGCNFVGFGVPGSRKTSPHGRPEAFTEPAPTQTRSMATAVIDDFFQNVNKHVRAIPGVREFAV